MILSNGLIQCRLDKIENNVMIGSLINCKTNFDWAAIESNNVTSIYSDTPSWISSKIIQTKDSNQEQCLETIFKNDLHIEAKHKVCCKDEFSVLRFSCSITNNGTQLFSNIIDLCPFSLRIKASNVIKVHTIKRDKYRLETSVLEREILSIRGGVWNKCEYAGWIVIEDVEAGEYMCIGIQWEREWELKLVPKVDSIDVSFGLVSYARELKPNETIESPNILMGLFSGDIDEASNGFRRYMVENVFPIMLKDFPWVIYDIWSTDDKDVEINLKEEAKFAAEIGVELFYIDATWWAGSSVRGSGAWGLGVGCYNEDRRKFPNGIKNFSDYIHSLGMKFGMWVDPMVIDENLVKGGLVPTYWLLQKDGIDSEYSNEWKDWPSVKQLCTGCPEVIEYLQKNLLALVENYSLDWLKWDDSALATPHCNRTDHGHGQEDGNFEALKGKYAIFNALMKKYPQLVIEQCGYPSRMDYGLAQYVRANWLSDSTTPSIYVRSNVEISSHVFPASYNSSWIIQDDETMNVTDPDIADSIVRSRMMGLFGMGTLYGKLSERISLLPQPIIDSIRRNISVYKQFRHLLRCNVWHLSQQKGNEDKWQVIEFSSYNGHEAVCFFFRAKATSDNLLCKLRGIDKNAIFLLKFISGASHRTMFGNTLINEGFTVSLAKENISEIVFISKV